MYDKKCNRSVFLRILPGQTHNDKLMGQIKRICRFVQQQDLGTQYKRLRHEHKLFLTAAQAAYRFSTQAIKPKLSQCVHHLFDLFIVHFPPEVFDHTEENHLKGRQTAGDGFKLRNIGDSRSEKRFPSSPPHASRIIETLPQLAPALFGLLEDALRRNA